MDIEYRRICCLVVLAVALGALPGCPSEPGSDQPPPDATGGPDVEALEAGFSTRRGLKPLEFSDLEPEVSTKGPNKVVPSTIVVEFSTDIRTDSGELGDATDLRLEPEVEGTWRAVGTDRIEFRAESSLRPGKSYDLLVESIDLRRHDSRRGETVDQRVTPASPPWSHTVEVPDFAFLELLTPVAHRSAGEIDVDVRFSAPPRTADLSEWAGWQVGGEPHRQVTYERGSRPNIVQATLRGLDLQEAGPEVDIDLQLAAGVPFDDETTAAEAEATTGAQFGPSVSIDRVFADEGGSGHYIHVVCDDASVDADKEFHNVEGYRDFEVSERCVPDIDSARRHIQIDPEVDFSLSPAPAGFQLHGDFQRESFEIEIKPGLQTIDGGVVEELTTETLEIGPRSPEAAIAGAGRYIPPEAWSNLPVRHRNLDAVRVEIRHVPRENLVFWLSGYNANADQRNSNRIAESRIDLGGEPDETKTSYVDLSKIVDERRPGVHQIAIHGLKRRDASERDDDAEPYRSVEEDRARYVATDVNLVAKRHAAGPDDAWSRTVDLWAIEMHTGEPIGGVEVETVRESGYELGKCTTSSSGHCRLEVAPKETDPAEPFALIAEWRDQVTFLEYADLETDVPIGDATGQPYLSDKPYRVSMYGDRDLYRPADTVHLAGLVRTADLGPTQAGLPVELELTDARGNAVRSRLVETNDIGAFEFSHELGDLAATGRWELEARIGDRTIETYEFLVEEFVPERMRVEVEPGTEHVTVGEQVTFDVHARYLFGASAEGSEVQLECRMEPEIYKPDSLAAYHVGPAPYQDRDEERQSTQFGTASATIDAEDRAKLGCDTEGVISQSSARVRGDVSVLEAGSGRSTDEQASGWVHPEPYTIGLKSDREEVEQGETFTVEGRLVDLDGEPSSEVDQVAIDVVGLERAYGRYYHSGHYSWSFDWREFVTDKRTVPVEDGRFEVEIAADQPRDAYAIRARAGDASSTLQVDVDRYSSYWGYGEDDQIPTPNAAPVEVDAPIEVGEETEVTVESPVDGRALVAVETHRVVDYQWIEVETGKNDWSFRLDEFAPNVYVTAFVVKDPHGDSEEAFVPKRAFGIQSAEVAPEQYDGEVAVETPDEVRPRELLEVDLEAEIGSGPAYATVAVVDEGILQLTDYESPNPLDTLLAERGLGVETFDTVGWNVEHPSLADPTGGGAAAPGSEREKAGRSMPVEPVALWSGLVELEEGRAQIPFNLPQFRGEVRVMAAAMSPQRIAADSTSVQVRDPLGLQATTPRFLTAEDRIEMPVMVTNQTGAERRITLEAQARSKPVVGYESPFDRQSPLAFEREPTREVTLADGASTTVTFPARAEARSGSAEVTFRATTEGHESTTGATIPLQPSGPSERKVETRKLEAGTTDLSSMLDGWVPRSERTTFRISAIPFSDALDEVQHLIRYPYGCLEQTVSSTRPLIYLSDLARAVDPSLLDRHDDLDEMVQSGIDRVMAMQHAHGGFRYWSSVYSPHTWSTAYAVDMLLDARDAGYDVPEMRLERALDWLDDIVRRSSDEHAHPMAHYALARAGEGDRALIRDAIEQRQPEEDESLEGHEREELYLLQAAAYHAGDRSWESDLKDLGALLEASDAKGDYGRSFYSNLRAMGLALSLKIDLFGRESVDESAIMGLARQMRDEWRLSTQEATWGVAALGKWVDARQVEQELGEVTLSIDDREIDPSHSNEERGPSWNVAHAADRGRVELSTEVGEEASWYVTVSSEGVRQTPTVEYGDHGLSIEREYVDGEGHAVDVGNLQVGELFYVRLRVESTSGDAIENVAIDDRLPAGLEIENPRLSGNPEVHETLVDDASYDGSPQRDGSWWYDHMNVRDDRLQIFGDVPHRESREVVYAVRATLAGTFQQPPLEAHAMYVPSVRSLKRGGTVRIANP